MASESGSGESGRGSGGRRRRPAPTIDLTATEVADSSAASPPPSEPQAAASDPAAPTEAPREESEPAAASAAEPPRTHEASEPPRTDEPSEPPRGGLPPIPRAALIAAGVIGSLVIALIVWGILTLSSRNDSTAVLNDRIAKLETAVRDLAARPAPAIDPKTINDLAARLDVIDGNLRRVDERLARAESALAAPRSAPTDPAVLERLGAAESMVRALNTTIADLRQRIDDFATTARDAKSRADAAAEEANKATAARPEASERRDLDELAARIAAVERAEQTIGQRIDQSMAGASADRTARLAMVATALRGAVERGVPFSAELAAARSLAPDNTALAPLEPAAANGVPSADALARELHQLQPALTNAAGTPAHEGGILDRLQSNAERLVRVRPLGETAGDDPAALVSRAVAKADRGDIAGALADLEKLPPAVKSHAAAWIKSARARTEAIDAAQKFAANAFAALGRLAK